MIKNLLINLFSQNCLVCGRSIRGTSICTFCSSKLQPRFWEKRCKSCYKPILNIHNDYCLNCQQDKNPIRYIRYIWEYKELKSIFIKQMKYCKSRSLLSIAGDYMVKNYKHYFGNDFPDVIIPAYSSQKSLYDRGFLHTYILAKMIYNYIKTYNKDVILATFNDFPKNYDRRAHLSLNLRLRYSKININLKESCFVNKKILFVDDMITTCSSALNMLYELDSDKLKSFDIYTLGVATDFYQNFEHSLEIYNKKRFKVL